MLALLLFWFATVPATTNTFWFSAAQRQALNDVAAVNHQQPFHYYVVIGGKKREYTECAKDKQPAPVGRFKDYKLVGTSTAACKPW